MELTMPEVFSEFLLALSDKTVLWAVTVIAAMAVTAVFLYVFWDLIGRGISLVTRVLNVGRDGRQG